MTKRTSQHDIQDWGDTQDLDHIVVDKRSIKRATPEKARRRNRRYEKRLIKGYFQDGTELDLDE